MLNVKYLTIIQIVLALMDLLEIHWQLVTKYLHRVRLSQ